MADPPENAVAAAVGAPSARTGDIPDALRRRYLTDRHGGPGVGFLVDTTVTVAAFRDHGRVLSASRTEPQVVRDLVAIARHRDWTIIQVRGSAAFRREVWMTGRAAGLEVRGYRPTERDVQALALRRDDHRILARSPGRQDDATRQNLAAAGPRARLNIVETVVRARVPDPLVQATLLAAARDRLNGWLDRGARFTDPLAGDRNRPPPERRR